MAGRGAGVANLRGSGFLNPADARSADELKVALADQARVLGFDCIGVTSPDAIAPAGRHFLDFIKTGGHADMDWLAANPERRTDPRGLWPDVRSVIMLGVNYGPEDDPLEILKQRCRGAISVYARGDDYHDVIKKNLKALAVRGESLRRHRRRDGKAAGAGRPPWLAGQAHQSRFARFRLVAVSGRDLHHARAAA